MELKTIAVYDDAFRARLDKNLLETEGIAAYILDEFASSIDWNLTRSVGGVKLQVEAEHYPEAKRFLASKSELRSVAVEDGDESALNNAREDLVEHAFRGAIIGLLLLPLQLYVTWLLLQVAITKGVLSLRYRILLLVSIAIHVPVMIGISAFLYWALLHPERLFSSSPRVDSRASAG